LETEIKKSNRNKKKETPEASKLRKIERRLWKSLLLAFMIIPVYVTIKVYKFLNYFTREGIDFAFLLACLFGVVAGGVMLILCYKMVEYTMRGVPFRPLIPQKAKKAVPVVITPLIAPEPVSATVKVRFRIWPRRTLVPASTSILGLEFAPAVKGEQTEISANVSNN
jgi:hypothetical protein